MTRARTRLSPVRAAARESKIRSRWSLAAEASKNLFRRIAALTCWFAGVFARRSILSRKERIERKVIFRTLRTWRTWREFFRGLTHPGSPKRNSAPAGCSITAFHSCLLPFSLFFKKFRAWRLIFQIIVYNILCRVF